MIRSAHLRSPTTEDLTQTFEGSLGVSFWLVEISKLIGKVVLVFFALIAYTCLLTGIIPLALQPYLIPFALPLGIAIGAFLFFQPEKEEVLPPLPALEKIELSQEEPRGLPVHPLNALVQVIRLEPIDWEEMPPLDRAKRGVWGAFSELYEAYRIAIASDPKALEEEELMRSLGEALSLGKELPLPFERQIDLLHRCLQERDPGRISFTEKRVLLSEDGREEKEVTSSHIAPYLSLYLPPQDHPYRLQECLKDSLSPPYRTEEGEICLRQGIEVSAPPPILRFHIDRRERDWRLFSPSKLKACSRCFERRAPPPAALPSYPPPPLSQTQKNKLSLELPPYLELPLQNNRVARYELLYLVEHTGNTLAQGSYSHYEKRGDKIFKDEWPSPPQGVWPPAQVQPYFLAYRRLEALQPRD